LGGYYDTIGKTCASQQQLYHRVVNISLKLNLRDRDRPMIKLLLLGGARFTNSVIARLCGRVLKCAPERKKGVGVARSDQVIEQVTKKSVGELFEEDGEENFREIEGQVLSAFAS
jgi:hypothetical protein